MEAQLLELWTLYTVGGFIWSTNSEYIVSQGRSVDYEIELDSVEIGTPVYHFLSDLKRCNDQIGIGYETCHAENKSTKY